MSGDNQWLDFTSLEDGSCGAILRAWWQDLADKDRPGRAELRRCADASAVAFVPAFHRLRRRLQQAGFRPSPRCLAAVAAVAAVIRHDHTGRVQTPGAQLGRAEGDRPVVSELRFRRLLEAASDLPERYAALRRIAAQLDSVDLGGFAQAAYDFTGRLRRQWAYDYYDTMPLKETSR